MFALCFTPLEIVSAERQISCQSFAVTQWGALGPYTLRRLNLRSAIPLGRNAPDMDSGLSPQFVSLVEEVRNAYIARSFTAFIPLCTPPGAIETRTGFPRPKHVRMRANAIPRIKSFSPFTFSLPNSFILPLKFRDVLRIYIAQSAGGGGGPFAITARVPASRTSAMRNVRHQRYQAIAPVYIYSPEVCTHLKLIAPSVMPMGANIHIWLLFPDFTSLVN